MLLHIKVALKFVNLPTLIANNFTNFLCFFFGRMNSVYVISISSTYVAQSQGQNVFNAFACFRRDVS